MQAKKKIKPVPKDFCLQAVFPTVLNDLIFSAANSAKKVKKKKQWVEFVLLLWLREDIKPKIKECKSWVNSYIF